VEKDLWIDEERGVILDAQVRRASAPVDPLVSSRYPPQRTFFERKERPEKIVNLGGNILRFILLPSIDATAEER